MDRRLETQFAVLFLHVFGEYENCYRSFDAGLGNSVRDSARNQSVPLHLSFCLSQIPREFGELGIDEIEGLEIAILRRLREKEFPRYKNLLFGSKQFRSAPHRLQTHCHECVPDLALPESRASTDLVDLGEGQSRFAGIDEDAAFESLRDELFDFLQMDHLAFSEAGLIPSFILQWLGRGLTGRASYYRATRKNVIHYTIGRRESITSPGAV
jgi:hypothetical protein